MSVSSIMTKDNISKSLISLSSFLVDSRVVL